MIINTFKKILLICLACFMSTIAIAQTQTVGVSIFDKEATADGYIFFSPGYSTDAFLVDNCGFLVNYWDRNSRPGLSGYLTETGVMLRTNKVTGAEYSQPSTGGNLELVDWDNNTIWSATFNQYEYIQHHDAVLMPNGNIIFIGWERISPQQQLEYGRRPNEVSYNNLWGEFIQEIKPIGTSDYEVVWEWHLQDHFVQDYTESASTYGSVQDEIGKVDINYLGPGAWGVVDWWHCNALHYNEELDHILVNSRNNNELWIIDHSTTTQQAQGSTGGNSGKGGELLYRWGNPEAYNSGNFSNLRMYGSHGHYWIPQGMPNAGKIMYFNNGDDRPEDYYSTIEMIQPIWENGEYKRDANNRYYPLEPEIVYQAPNPSDFVSEYLSNAKQLSNGNVFINEGGSGRLFEIDSDQNIVWQYEAPVNFYGPVSQGESINGNHNFRAYKYEPDYPGLAGQDLTPGELLEGDSEFNLCKSVSTNNLQEIEGFQLTYDMGSSTLFVDNQTNLDLNLRISSIDGKMIQSQKVIDVISEVNLNHLNQGIYIVAVVSTDGKKQMSKKIVRF